MLLPSFAEGQSPKPLLPWLMWTEQGFMCGREDALAVGNIWRRASRMTGERVGHITWHEPTPYASW